MAQQIKCENCEQMYSASRSKCPHCGAKRTGSTRRGGLTSSTQTLVGIVFVAVLIILVVTVIVITLNKGGDEGSTASPSGSADINSVTVPVTETEPPPKEDDIPVSQIVFMNIKTDSFTLPGVGGTFPLGGVNGENEDVILYPREATGRTTIKWSSENEQVAIVNTFTGLVTAVGAGTTRIIVTAGKDGFTKAVTVTVDSNELTPGETTPPGASSSPGSQSSPPSGGVIKLSHKDVSLSVKGTSKLGKDFTLKVKLSNESSYATEGMVYSSTNEKVATVNDKGVVTATGKGYAKIKVSYQGQEATCEIHVAA